VCRFTTGFTGGVTGVAAAITTAEVAWPPSAFTTTKLTAVAVAALKVQVTVNEVEETTVVGPQVPFAVGETDDPTKPVPVMVKASVEFAVTVAGDTDVIVGPAAMKIDAAGAKPATFT
jgi:hypothetical protein